MKWTYSIKNKLLASVVLLVLCLLVLLSHYLDRIHTKNVKNSITTLYEDRLIAEDLILKMTSNIYQIREVYHSAINDDLKSENIRKLMEDFEDSYNIYMKTKLTKNEKVTAIELIGYMDDFKKHISVNPSDLSNYTEKSLMSLIKLSDVQLEESKLIMKNAEAEYAAIKASSQFAFGIVIIILLVLQAMVFSSKTLMPVNKPGNPNLN